MITVALVLGLLMWLVMGVALLSVMFDPKATAQDVRHGIPFGVVLLIGMGWIIYGMYLVNL